MSTNFGTVANHYSWHYRAMAADAGALADHNPALSSVNSVLRIDSAVASDLGVIADFNSTMREQRRKSANINSLSTLEVFRPPDNPMPLGWETVVDFNVNIFREPRR